MTVKVTLITSNIPMNTRYTTLETSAMAEADKRQSLSMEVVRRLQRIDQRRPNDERIQVIDDYCDMPRRSG